MSMKSGKLFIVKNPEGRLVVNTLRITASMSRVIAQSCIPHDMGKGLWKDLYKSGYRCIPCKILTTK